MSSACFSVLDGVAVGVGESAGTWVGDGIRLDEGDGEGCEDSMGVELGLFAERVGVVVG